MKSSASGRGILSMRDKFILGVTGNVCSGKTTIVEIFRELGCKVIDADEIAHEVIEEEKVKERIKKIFGNGIINSCGLVDRKRLGKIVFNSPKLLRKLEKILHPIIIKIIKFRVKTYKKGVIVLCAPLLFEVGLENIVDKVLVVSVDKEEQVRRLMKRDNLSRREALKIINLQMPAEKKIKKADYVIDTTNKKIHIIKNEVKKLYNEIREAIEKDFKSHGH